MYGIRTPTRINLIADRPGHKTGPSDRTSVRFVAQHIFYYYDLSYFYKTYISYSNIMLLLIAKIKIGFT
jgi:hypothetical protein